MASHELISRFALPYLPLALMLLAIIFPQWAERSTKQFRHLVTGLVGVQMLLAIFLLTLFLTKLVPATEFALWQSVPLLNVYLDGVSLLMLTLVSFVGWLICRFSIRYLDGESTQGRYFRWTAFTIGAVSSMVIAGNLLQFFIAWVLTSSGLHQLLLHYSERPAARRAAWTKFTISRIGDVALVIAFIILYTQFGTLRFAELFEAVKAQSANPSIPLQVAGILLALGAITKSAQFPFHTWLPLTMETPTPVSALMHAGVVNAGGYLMIRVASIISLSAYAMVLLAVVGAFTACFGAIVMMTQTSIKRKLAYSTIAQMGFMLMQCGLGAFSAAMLHILAHSLFKAHAFLSSGSVVAQRASTAGALTVKKVPSMVTALALIASMLAFVWGCFACLGVDLAQKTGGLLLAMLLCISLTFWMLQAIGTIGQRVWLQAVPTVAGLLILYVVSFLGVDAMVGITTPPIISASAVLVMAAIIGFGFVGMLYLNLMLLNHVESNWLNRLQIHAANGFYVENWLRRWFGSLLTS